VFFVPESMEEGAAATEAHLAIAQAVQNKAQQMTGFAI
jgi:hypothetical protein